jgi:DNA polymerase III subunit delta
VKLGAARLAAFLTAPDPAIRAVLVYGPDQGLVKERADRIAAAIVPDRHPFRIAELQAGDLSSDPALLEDEARALSLIPGRRVVRVKGAGDGLAALFERFLDAPPPGDSLVVVEAAELAARSNLRRAFEGAKAGAAIQCYPDGEDELRDLARSVLGAHKVALDADAMAYLVTHLGSDRALSRQELEKLALYAGDGGRVGYDEARAVVGDTAEITLDDALFAASAGEAAAVERCLGRAFGEGDAAVTVLRAAQRHFQRLYLAGARVAHGMGAEEAMNGLCPPLFREARDRFRSALRLWPPRRAALALEALLEAERNAKRTGIPAEAVCRDVLLRIARGAAARR